MIHHKAASKTSQKNHPAFVDEIRKSIFRSDIDILIQQGSIAKEGSWYRIYDMEVLRNKLTGLIKRMSVSNKGMLVQLYK